MEPRKMLYCGICSMPPEYCEFSGTQEKCKEWLKLHHEDVYDDMYSVQDVGQGVEKVSLEDASGEKRSDRTLVKDKSAKLEAKLERENKKKMSSRVIIKRVERTKRKCVTTIHGLDIFDVDLKKAAKMFANKFACGSSVAKNNQNQDEIVVQGDFSDELFDLILANWSQVPEDNIDIVEEKKKKGGN
ncbi:mitochondrial translation initiation factor [Radiomyces spectabilis]|uniref:mitochondrial translation initiation factor n=1 Tax=Radiomyces spectabilis TaxID=64574 RepID=UPI00221FBEC5|nr:mitochondrial translation initiation factor [Radiomyces spectabilis]KAI8381513.1 mitochondrial translation initiation factor [Radiomyces spectabilis]